MRPMGLDAERNLYIRARQHGRKAHKMRYGFAFDLLIDDWRIEVKSAEISGIRKTWKFNIHRHGRVVESCDFYAFQVKGAGARTNAIWLLLKAPLRRPTVALSLAQIQNGCNRHRKLMADLLHGRLGLGTTPLASLNALCKVCRKSFHPLSWKNTVCSERCLKVFSGLRMALTAANQIGLSNERFTELVEWKRSGLKFQS
jgi:hypothetical protein